AEPHRRVERSRHRAGELRAEERREKLDAGGEDEGDAVAALDAEREQTSRHGERPLANLRPAEPGLPLVPVEKAETAFGMAARLREPVGNGLSHRASSGSRTQGRRRSRWRLRPVRPGKRENGSPPPQPASAGGWNRDASPPPGACRPS